jgi:DNA repair exonuclease SbcCD ATPase subunit
MQERMDESLQRERFSSDAVKHLKAREQELLQYRELIQQQEKQLDEYRTRLKHEQMAREKELQKELETREKHYADREMKLFARQKEIEHRLMSRQDETEALRTKLEHEVVTRESQLQDALQQLKLEKERYTEEGRKKIERTSKDYVADTLSALDRKEVQFHLISKIWSGIGAASLAGGLGQY